MRSRGERRPREPRRKCARQERWQGEKGRNGKKTGDRTDSAVKTLCILPHTCLQKQQQQQHLQPQQRGSSSDVLAVVPQCLSDLPDFEPNTCLALRLTLVQLCKLQSFIGKGSSQERHLLLFERHSCVNEFGDRPWCRDEAYRTQHHRSREEGSDVHDTRRQPSRYSSSGLRGEACDDPGQQCAWEVPSQWDLTWCAWDWRRFRCRRERDLECACQDKSAGKSNQVTISDEKGHLSQDTV